MKLTLTAALCLFALTACQTLNVDRNIHAANQGITIVLTSTDKALNAHRISSKQAESVSKIAHQVNPLLDAAKAASDAGDKAGASKTLKLADKILAALDAYVPPTR
jgi:hypothetical protein